MMRPRLGLEPIWELTLRCGAEQRPGCPGFFFPGEGLGCARSTTKAAPGICIELYSLPASLTKASLCSCNEQMQTPLRGKLRLVPDQTVCKRSPEGLEM